MIVTLLSAPTCFTLPPTGYCQISCGRCDCCKSMDKILKQQGLNMFAWALNFTEYGEYIAMPGFMATLLAPTDDAMNDMLGKLGENEGTLRVPFIV